MDSESLKPTEVTLEDFFTKIISVIGKTTASQISSLLTKNRLTVSVAESMTAGMLCSLMAEIPGSSQYFIGGLVCYHNRIKVTELNIPPAIISQHGPVSSETAIAMAENIRKKFKTNIGLSTTGVAGPVALPPAPVGMAYIAIASDKATEWKELRLQGTRTEIREKTARAALGLLWLHLGGQDILSGLNEGE
ncbi:MAG: CinA family protein [Candidatus Saganbacteria bacterium]|nr:CinA family protein [Candidatus Saganbacteria bacterium]